MPGSVGATVLDDLPESIVVQEILVRLPPKDILRCRAVRKCWRSATSTDSFILDHHRRQPLLPILGYGIRQDLDQKDTRLFVPRDAGAGRQQLSPVLRYSRNGTLHGALDGLLIACERPGYFICNPVTRECAPLWTPQSQWYFLRHIVAFYRHQPSGEYRVLWFTGPTDSAPPDKNYTTAYSVVAVGSDNPRCVRLVCIPQPAASSSILEVVLRGGLYSSSNEPPVHHRGGLHWKIGNSGIMVFDTVAETFRLMSSPAQLPSQELLLAMDGTLTFCRISRDSIDIWVIQDYDAEIWSFKRRISLSFVDPPSSLDLMYSRYPKMVVLNEGELLIQFPPAGRVLRYDVDGKFLGYVKREEDQEVKLWISKHYLQESVIPLPLFHKPEKKMVDSGASIFRRAVRWSASSGCSTLLVICCATVPTFWIVAEHLY